jgi:signal transducing adaptor molecule
MSQPPQPAYGGRPGYGTYNAPPPSNFTGYPPVSSTPQQGYGGAPPQHGPPSQVPPVGSSPAFFMVPPGEQRTQQQTPKPGPPSDPYAQSQGRVPVGGRPQSYAPQELATGQFDSPVDNRHSFHAPSQPQGGPSAPQGYDYPPSQQGSGYPPQQSAAQQGPPQGQQNPYEQPSHDQPPSDLYSQQPPQQGFGYPPSQPGYAPPGPPAVASSDAPAQGYLPYRPGGQAPSAPPVGGDDAAGFYR